MRATISVLLTAALAMALMALSSCKRSSDTEGESAQESTQESAQPPPAPSGGNRAAEQTAALEEAWNADPNCQLLVNCCAALGGTSWEQMLQPLCLQIQDLQNFEQQVENMVDPAWQANDCRNRVAGLAGMANPANPLPAACTAP